jgi:aminoglycoside N3'-acetyltransferase
MTARPPLEGASVERIADDLRGLGVVAGDLIMLHASLRRVGPVVGGADGLLDALEAVVGPEGTVLMTLGARDDWDWVNERPESERAELLRDAEPFDRWVTPASTDVGALAEVFRQRAGTLVSDNPEGRFGATGRLARALLEDAPWDDYYGPGSPLARFVDAGGRVLRLGADLDTVTVLHFAEYVTPVVDKRRVRRHRMVAGANGPELRAVECLNDDTGIVEYPGEDYFAQIVRAYLATGRARSAMVGAAVSELLDGADVVQFGSAWMASHFNRQ